MDRYLGEGVLFKGINITRTEVLSHVMYLMPNV